VEAHLPVIIMKELRMLIAKMNLLSHLQEVEAEEEVVLVNP
jgi:hypothetical protein